MNRLSAVDKHAAAVQICTVAENLYSVKIGVHRAAAAFNGFIAADDTAVNTGIRKCRHHGLGYCAAVIATIPRKPAITRIGDEISAAAVAGRRTAAGDDHVGESRGFLMPRQNASSILRGMIAVGNGKTFDRPGIAEEDAVAAVAVDDGVAGVCRRALQGEM